MLSKQIREQIEQDLRLYMLQLLADNPGYHYNLGLLRRLLCEGITDVSLSRCKEIVLWLYDHKLVEFSGERFGKLSSADVVHLTQAGKEVAAGTQVIDGVRRPEPHEVYATWPHVELPPLLPKD